MNFSYISDEFCKEIIKILNINLILDKLIYFYPIFKPNIDYSNNTDKFNSQQKVETFFIGMQIFRFLGNLYISSNNHDAFKQNNFYNKIIELLCILNIEKEKNSKYNLIYLEFLETLIWLFILFIEHDENFIFVYKNELLVVIPKLLSNIKILQVLKANDKIDKILHLLLLLFEKNSELVVEINYVDCLNVLLDLIISLFNDNNKTECIFELNTNILDKILDIFISIFYLDSSYLKNFNNYSTLSTIIKKLILNLNPRNNYNEQSKLINLLSNLACFNDINDIITKILLNRNVIKALFHNYYQYHKFDIIFFISNAMEKQSKNVRDFLLENVAFDIFKNNICNNNKNIKITKISIKALYQLIKAEKSGNIKLLFEKIYNTAIPDKIKELVNDKSINSDIDNETFIDKIDENIPDIFDSLIHNFEEYEKSLDFN